MTPVWSPEAIDDLVSLRTYISEDDPAAARRVALHIIHNVEALLSENPQMGRAGRVPGTRELVIPNTPFIVPYRVQGGSKRDRALVFVLPKMRDCSLNLTGSGELLCRLNELAEIPISYWLFCYLERRLRDLPIWKCFISCEFASARAG